MHKLGRCFICFGDSDAQSKTNLGLGCVAWGRECVVLGLGLGGWVVVGWRVGWVDFMSLARSHKGRATLILHPKVVISRKWGVRSDCESIASPPTFDLTRI